MGFELRASGNVPAPPGRVWAQLLDRDRIPGWLEGIATVGGEGERVLVRREQDPASIQGRVSDFDPRRRLALRFAEPTSLLREVRIEIALADADGGTDYDVRVHAEPRGVGSLLSPLLRFRSEVALVRAVGGFRAALDDGRERERRSRSWLQRGAAPLATPEETRLAASG